MVNKKVWLGSQRWFYKVYKHYFSDRKPVDLHQLYADYLMGKQTQILLSQPTWRINGT